VIAALLAIYLHKPPALVELVYSAGGTEAVAIVQAESQFFPQALRVEPRGHSSWGLFAIDNEWWLQYRYDLGKHIDQGVAIMAHFSRGLNPDYDFAIMVARFNGGWKPGAYSIAWGRKVERLRDDMAHYLWIHLR
jgi:hypothetical protein